MTKKSEDKKKAGDNRVAVEFDAKSLQKFNEMVRDDMLGTAMIHEAAEQDNVNITTEDE